MLVHMLCHVRNLSWPPKAHFSITSENNTLSLCIVIYKELGAVTTERVTSHHEVHGAPLSTPTSAGPRAAHHEGGWRRSRTGDC